MHEHLRFKVERWSLDGGKLYDTLALCSTVEFAEAVYEAAIKRQPLELHTISQGARLLRRSNALSGAAQ